MSAIKSWTVSEEMWSKVEPLIPARKREKGRKYRRKPGGGRKPLDMRKVFEGIVYVLRTGCQWKALPEERFGSASSIHKYFQAWKQEGVFVRLWRKGLADWDQDATRIRMLLDKADIAIYTPGSNAGLPLSVLKTFAAPSRDLVEDTELFRQRISTTVSPSSVGIIAPPLRSAYIRPRIVEIVGA